MYIIKLNEQTNKSKIICLTLNCPKWKKLITYDCAIFCVLSYLFIYTFIYGIKDIILKYYKLTHIIYLLNIL